MDSLPTTPDSNATALGQVSGDDEFPPQIEGSFEIELLSGATMTCSYDGLSSVGWALRQALDNEQWFGPRHRPRPKCDLIRNGHVLKGMATKIYEIFDGYADNERRLSLVLHFDTEGADTRDDADTS